MLELEKCHCVWYRMNARTGCYQKTAAQPTKHPFKTAPFELIVEKTQDPRIRKNAREIIRGKEKMGLSWKFFTGLIPTRYPNCFVGQAYRFEKGKKKTSLIIFIFSEDNSDLTMFYFSDYDKRNTNERLAFAEKVIPTLYQTRYHAHLGAH